MKIKNIVINNFRSISHDKIDCRDFNSFVGPNGSGKSTVLSVLNVFFGETNSFSEDDFHRKVTDKPFMIKVTFHELSDAAKKEFRHYVRADQLVVFAEVSSDSEGGFKRVIRGERLVFKPFAEFFEAKSAKDRGKVFNELKESYPDIDSATNDDGRKSSLNTYEENLPEAEKELTASGAEFFGITKGVQR